MRCGLRLGDALKLPHDCTIQGSDSAPYLRYYNHKMKREALVPIDDELAREIGEQQLRIRDHWPKGTPVLFPDPEPTPTEANPPATPATATRWTSGCNAATSATSTASRSGWPPINGGTLWALD